MPWTSWSGPTYTGGVVWHDLPDETTPLDALDLNTEENAEATYAAQVGQSVVNWLEDNIPDPDALSIRSLTIPSVSGLGPLYIGVGPSTDTNPPHVFGYNQLPDYVVSDGAEPGLSFIVEPNYNDGSGHNKMEAYVQFLPAGASGLDTGTRRPFFSQIDRVTGLPTQTVLSAGVNGNLSLNINDNTGTASQKQIGREALAISLVNRATFGAEAVSADGKTIFTIRGVNDAGNTAELDFIDGNSAQYFAISQRATANGGSELQFNFNGGTPFMRMANTGDVSLAGKLIFSAGTNLYGVGATALRSDGTIQAGGGASQLNSDGGVTGSQFRSSLIGGGTISQGSGAPGLPGGGNPAVGDIWLRTDTPGTVNQRIYICTVGGATPTWVGIV